jgi:translocation and assembly module TamB
MAPDTPRRGRIARRIARWIGGTALGLILLLALGLGALQTGTGKGWLAATLSDVASEATGFTVRIGAIEGTVPTDVSVATVEIADAQGVWLTAEDVALAWQPLDLIDGRLSIARLSAVRVDVARAPAKIDAPAEPAPASAPLAIELPELPLAVSIADVEIGEIRLGAPLLGADMGGEEIVAAAFGSAALGAKPQEVEIALTVLRLDGVPARIELMLAQAPDRRLGLEATVEEPAGGLIARLLGLPDLPAIALHLAGSGPATGWTGRLDATAGDATAGLDLSLALDDRIDLALAGTVDPGGLAGPELRDLLPRPVAVDAALAWVPGQALSIDRAALSAPGLDATVQGRIDQAAETIDATAELAATDPALIARLADPVRADALRATARISGNLAAPTLAVEATADQLVAPGIEATVVEAEASLAPTDDPARFSLSARIAPQGLVVDGDPSLVALIGAAPILALDGTLDPAGGRLDMAQFDIAGAALRATGSGHVAEEGRDLDLALAVRLDDLAPLGDLAGRGMGGALDADLRIVGDATVPVLAVDLEARGDGIALADPLLAAIVGAAPHLVAAATLDGAAVSIDSARLTAAALTADATGTVGETIELAIDASAPALAPLSTPVGVDLAGGLTVSAQVSGAVADPAVTARLSGSRMALAGVALGDPTAEISVAGIAAEPQGEATLIAAPGGATLRADTTFRILADGGVWLDDLKIDGAGGTRLVGDLGLGADGRVDGTLDGEIADLAVWERMAGTPLAGAVGFRLSASAGQGQHLSVEATGRDLVLADAATIRGLRLDAEIDDALAAPAIEARLAAEGVAADALSFDTVNATAQGTLDDLGWTLAASGAGEKPVAVDAEGRLALGDAGGTVTVAALAATLASIETALTQPAILA